MNFEILKDHSYNVKRFNVKGRKVEFRIKTPPQNIQDPEGWIKEGIKQIISTSTANLQPTDKVGITFCSNKFDRGPGWINFQDVNKIKWGDVWSMISGVFQSNSEGLDTDTFCLRVTSVRLPQGSGNDRARRYNTFEEECALRRGIVTINNKDNLCLPRALVVAMANATKDANYSKIRRDIGKLQTKRVEELLNNSKVQIPKDGAGIPELRQFQQYLKDFKITVYQYGTKGRDVIYEGPEAKYKINLLYNDNHYNVIVSLTAAFCCVYYCESCHISYDTKNKHRCGGSCPGCQQSPACLKTIQEITCAECNRKFRGQSCFDHHKSLGSLAKDTVCNAIKRCVTCLKTYKNDREHICGEKYCKICAKHVPEDHLCYIQPNLRAPSTSNTTYLFYDLETRQDKIIDDDNGTKLHEPVLCVFQQRCDKCMDLDSTVIVCEKCGVRRQILDRREPLLAFLNHILQIRKNFKNVIVIAHNGQAFDHQFILNHIMTNTNITPELILRGTRIILMQLENIKFIDSLNYFPMPLATLPKAFDLPTLKKGHFPHFFNTEENQNYVGPLPDKKYYDPNGMKPEERAKFLEWYEEHKNDNFDMQRDMVDYCISDVEILTQACRKFREIMLKECRVEPFIEAVTIASTCNLVHRRNFLKPNTIGIIPKGGYRFRDNQSPLALKWLIWESDRRKIKIQHAGNGKEVKLKGVKVDGFCAETNQIFEMQGCYFHGCPVCLRYNRNSPLHDDNKDTLERRYEATQAKIERLRSFGYDVIEKWECEFRRELESNAAEMNYLHTHSLLDTTPLQPRDAFFGGRTGNASQYYRCGEGEKIKYVDIMSLYPFVCKYGKMPLGHPRLYVGHQECESLDMKEIDGLVKCTILPPQNLHHPVLPTKMNNKLMFVLCRACGEQLNQSECTHSDEERAITGTWVIDEVLKALEKGYKILQYYEIWSYQIAQHGTADGGLFTEFINCFLKMKAEASGWPSFCKTDEERQKYIEDFLTREDIQLEYEAITKNAGLRCLAKLILNSFWGKYGQRENQPKTSIVRLPAEFFCMLTNPATDVNNIYPINDNALIVSWGYKEESYDSLPTVNVAIAAYTTAQARLKLYSYLEKLQERVLYYDTDSVIYVSRDGEWDVPTGGFLGDMTNELEEYGPEAYISEFISGGPKNYSYRVYDPISEKTWEKTKVKGFSLNYANSNIINFDTVKNLLMGGGGGDDDNADNDDHKSIQIFDRRIRCTKDHRIVSKGESKVYKITSNKRKFFDDYTSQPYGYVKKLCIEKN